jgi:hypothetical protein
MMNELTWEKITDVPGRIQAEVLKAFMESEGVPVHLIQEGLGESVYPFTFGPLGEVQVFVPKEKLEQARALLESYEQGNIEEVAEDSSKDDEAE